MSGIHVIAKAAGIQDDQAYALFDAIVTHVKDGGRVQIKDFGSFFTSVRKARTVTSPQVPNGRVEVPERTVLRFRPSPSTKSVLNPVAAVPPAENGKAKKPAATAAKPAKKPTKQAATEAADDE